MRVIIAAAGTAGHINPGIAIANKIKKEEPDSEIVFIGTNRGLENDLVPRAGYELKQIEAYGLGKNIIKNLKTFKGLFQAKKIIKEFKPDVIIGAGGYICGPVIMAGYLKKIPTVLHESNAFPGKAVKMLSNKTNTILISFEEARNRIPKAKNVVLTGTPIKIDDSEITIDRKLEIIKEHNLENTKPIVLIFGGSQGAKKINDAVVELLSQNLNLPYQIILATGSKQYDNVVSMLNEKKVDITTNNNARIYPYIYELGEIEKASDLVICRSGATTIAEIARIGKPAIFIPLPNVSNDHQTYNAKVLEDIDSAKIIKNDELTGKVLDNKIREMIEDRAKLQKMGKNARKIDISNVEDRIYQEIKKVVG
jgi:UDP-N-acetylglucosamine--N-acetylmuramyl-(pentapeptide) pyrophosphoryl-undecaprenol N-acetylglucosamine transferase